MIDSYFRAPYQRVFIDPFVKMKIFSKITPIHLTLFGAILGVFSCYFLAIGQNFLAVLLILFSGYLDTLDGSVARVHGKTSPLGSVLDIFCDRLVEFSILLGFYLQDPTRGLSVILMLGSILLCITSFLVVGIFSENESEKSFYYSPGLIERTEAFFFFIALALLSEYFVYISLLFSFLVSLTALIRLKEFAKKEY